MADLEKLSLRDAYDALLDLPVPERSLALRQLEASNAERAKRLAAMLGAISSPQSTIGLWPKLALPDQRLEPGQRIGQYLVIREIGHGGVAYVYLAVDERLGRKVALKSSSLRADEPRLLARLPFRHIVQAYNSVREETLGLEILVLQYVAGFTLQHAIESGLFRGVDAGRAISTMLDEQLGEEDDIGSRERRHARLHGLDAEGLACAIAEDVAAALAFAHERGVLHLDVKPSNVFLDPEGRAVLADFNVSVDSVGLCQPLGGTEKYMAPEQRARLKGKDVTLGERADLFALGVVLEEMLGGEGKTLARFAGELGQLEPDSRPKSARETQRRLARAAHWRNAERLRRERHAGSKTLGFAWKHPVWAALIAAFVPNAIGSALQVAYNKVHIVDAATDAQRALFKQIVGPWNAFVFAAGLGFLLWRFRPMWRNERALGHIQTNPIIGAVVAGGGWTMGCCLFLGALSHWTGPIASELVAHFVVSFSAAGLLAAAYALHGLAFVSAGAWLPRLVDPVAKEETLPSLQRCARSVRRLVRTGRFFAATLPLAGAAIIVTAGPSLAAGRGYPFQALVVSFLALSSAGFFFANRLTELGERELDAVDAAVNVH